MTQPRCGAGWTRRGWLLAAGLLPIAARAAPLLDVLERPAAPARITAAAPMLRVVRCGRRLVSVGERGIVLFSDDDGQRWQQARVPVSVTLTGVQFTSAKRGFAIGHGGVVLRSDDAGQSWQRLLDGRQIPALLSTDAARQAEADGPDKPWLALHFSDDQNGMVVGAFGMALETSDGGQTWRSFADRLANPRALHLHAVQRRGERVWIAGEQGLYAQSVDGGRHFSALPTPYRGSFFALHPLDDGRALLAGLRGTLLLHAGGEQFRTVPAASTQGVVQLLALHSETPAPANATATATAASTSTSTSTSMVALLDQAGRIFTATLADLHFKPWPVSPARTWLAIAQAADGTLVGASFDGVARLQPTLSLPKP